MRPHLKREKIACPANLRFQLPIFRDRFRVQIGPGAGVFHFIPGPADGHAENEFLVQVNLRLVQYFAIRVIVVHHMRFRSTSPVRFVPTRSKILKRPAATFLAATNEIYTV